MHLNPFGGPALSASNGRTLNIPPDNLAAFSGKGRKGKGKPI